MLNETQEDPNIEQVVCSYPAVPVGGGVVIQGDRCGIAEDSEASDGTTIVNFGPWVGKQSVTDINTGGIAIGAPLFASKADPVVLSNLSTGVFFGWAREVVTTGATKTISVKKGGDSGGVLAASAIGTTQLATSAVTAAKMTWPVDPSAITPGTTLTGTLVKIGTSATPFALNTAGQTGLMAFFSTTAATLTTYGKYLRLDALGAGAETIAGRFKTLLKIAAVGNAHGLHATLETDTSAGDVTGLGTGVRGNVVLANRAITEGTYYGVLGEIYPNGATSDVPAGSNAALAANIQPGTALDLTGNLVAFSGTDGSTKPIYTHGAGNTSSGSIRILVNGQTKFLRFYDAE